MTRENRTTLIPAAIKSLPSIRPGQCLDHADNAVDEQRKQGDRNYDCPKSRSHEITSLWGDFTALGFVATTNYSATMGCRLCFGRFSQQKIYFLIPARPCKGQMRQQQKVDTCRFIRHRHHPNTENLVLSKKQKHLCFDKDYSANL